MNGYNQADPKNYEDILESITVEDVMKHAARYTDKRDVIDIMFVPAK